MLLRLHMLLTCANDATFIEYVATLAHVVYVGEHKFDVTLIEYVVTFAHTPKKTTTWNNGSQSLLPKKTNPMEEPTKIVGSGREASSGGKMLPSQVPFWKNFPNACGRVEKDASKPFGRGISCINRHFQTFFSACLKKMTISPARKIMFFILNWLKQYKMIL